MDKTLFELFESKHLAIDEIIKYLSAPICGATVIGKEMQKYYDAHDLAVIILRKYQKIEQLIADYENEEWEQIAVYRIREIIDGKDD